jgi:hypothetical protein
MALGTGCPERLCAAALVSGATFSYRFAAGAAERGAVSWPTALVNVPTAMIIANVAIVEARALKVGASITAEQNCYRAVEEAGHRVLIFIGRVVTGRRGGISARIFVVCVVVRVLLGCRALLGRRGRAREAIAAAAEQDRSSKDNDGEERNDCRRYSTFHGDKKLLG